MSAQTFACFSDFPHELQQHIWEYTIIDALDDAWDNEHGSQSVRIPDGNIIWRRGSIVPVSSRNLSGLLDSDRIIFSCALARKLCLQHHKYPLLSFMENFKQTLYLSQAAKEAALQCTANFIKDVDELHHLLDVASRGSAANSQSRMSQAD